MEVIPVAYVSLWDNQVGSVVWNQDREYATFEFEKRFIEKGLDLSPIKMPLREILRSGKRIFEFPELSQRTFRGLPGLLSDSLPDRFGNRIINAWLARSGRTSESFNPIERLCYTGIRGMGALEFKSVPGEIKKKMEKSVPVVIQELVDLVQEALDEKTKLSVTMKDSVSDALSDILRVGTSAGGIRPKAIIALNDQTDEVRSGQVEAPKGFDYWILKFDGVKDDLLNDPEGYGCIEYAYYLMAVKCQIEMTECRLLRENNRAHFMTRRFDRTKEFGKLHLQSLCAIAHFDYNYPGEYSYEQAFQVMRELRLPYYAKEQLFRRMVFNIVARNQDDHTKNISFIMDQQGRWTLAPAYDVIYSYNSRGKFTGKHQMTLNGKRDGFIMQDLFTVGHEMNIKSYKSIINEIIEIVSQWHTFAKNAGVDKVKEEKIYKNLRIDKL